MKAIYQKYKVVPENGEFLITDKNGLILDSFPNRGDALDFILKEKQDQERQMVMSAYNKEQELKALMFEFQSEVHYAP